MANAPRMVAPDRVLSMDLIELNCVLILNWIVWNRTVLTFKLFTHVLVCKTELFETELFWHSTERKPKLYVTSSRRASSTDIADPLVTSPYHSSLLAGLQGYIPYLHIAAVCMFEQVILLLLGHMWGSIGVYHWWVRPCLSSSVLRVWFV